MVTTSTSHELEISFYFLPFYHRSTNKLGSRYAYLFGCLVIALDDESTFLSFFNSAPVLSKLLCCINTIWDRGCWRMGGWGAGPLFSDMNVWDPFFEGVRNGWWGCLTLFLPFIFSLVHLELRVVVSLLHDEDDVFASTNCIELLFVWEFPGYVDTTVVVVIKGCCCCSAWGCWCTMICWDDEAAGTNWPKVVVVVIGLELSLLITFVVK